MVKYIVMSKLLNFRCNGNTSNKFYICRELDRGNSDFRFLLPACMEYMYYMSFIFPKRQLKLRCISFATYSSHLSKIFKNTFKGVYLTYRHKGNITLKDFSSVLLKLFVILCSLFFFCFCLFFIKVIFQNDFEAHSVHWDINPRLQKHSSPLFLAKPSP